MIRTIKDFISDKNSKKIHCNYAIGIATTSDNKISYFSFPREIKDWGYYFHCIFPNSALAIEALEELEDNFDYFFIDSEPKNENFSSHYIINKKKHLNFKKIYPNNLTVQASLDLISLSNSNDFFIFGHGSLAYELAFNIEIKGKKFKWTSSRSSNSKKYLKMSKSFGNYEFNGNNIDTSTLIINCCPYNTSKLNNICKTKKYKIIDITAKYPFNSDMKGFVQLVDVSSRICHEISYSMTPNKYFDNYGKIKKNGINIISGGYQGSYGDLVVDNYKDPKYVIGISDGLGGFKKRINKAYIKK